MQWGGPTDGISDCSVYFNKMVQGMEGGGKLDTVIEFPTGVFRFKLPTRTLPQITIRGQGMLSTTFLRGGFLNGAFLQSDGSKGNGITIENLAFLTPAGFNSGPCNCLQFTAGSVYSPDGLVLRNLWISSGDGGLWENCIFLDGLARTAPQAQGIRDCYIENCDLFNARSAAYYIRNGVGVTVRGGGCFPGAGAADGSRIIVTGAPAIAIVGSSWSGGQVTFLTASDHRIQIGQNFTVSGCTPNGYNGSYVSLAGGGASSTQLNAALTSNPGGMTVNGTVLNPLLSSNTCHFSDVILNGELNISSSLGGSFRGPMGSLNTDGSSRWRIDGQCYGNVANNLVNSKVDLY